MAGNGEGAQSAPVRPPVPKVKTFSCLQCGQPITVRGLLQTATVACSACGTVIDVSDENMRILSAFTKQALRQPAIPLGTRGTMKDGIFEVIGFMQRETLVEGVAYRWREYLLFNPYKGFRWLSEDNGHWTYIKTSLHRPRMLADGSMNFKGTRFQHFQSAQASVEYVIGEFYWELKQNERCLVQDFVAPPQMLSMEQSGKEITWSLGEYIEPDAVRKAFKLAAPLPACIGVGACQPSPLANQPLRSLKLAGIFVAVALLIQAVSFALSENTLVFEDSFEYDARSVEKSRVTDLFELNGRTSNVVVRTNANVQNNWIYLSMALINDETGTAYDFGREIGYYSGRDSDGSWSEGRQSDEAVLSRIPSGRYYLRIEPEGTVSTAYTVRVFRDVPRWWPLLVTLGVLMLVPLISFWRSRSFEYQRWSESDHPILSLSDLTNREDDD
jgi:hypothetical protein